VTAIADPGFALVDVGFGVGMCTDFLPTHRAVVVVAVIWLIPSSLPFSA